MKSAAAHHIPSGGDPASTPWVQAPDRDQRCGVWRQCTEFLRDFVHFAGRRAAVSALLIGLGALLEGVGIVMLIPILTLATEPLGQHGHTLAAASWLFEHFGLSTRFTKLVFLLAVFGILMTCRAVVIARRDATLMRLEIGFVEDCRLRVIRRLAAARWDVIAGLRHARVTQLLGGDIQQIGRATHFFQQCAVSAVMLTSQCVLALALSPLLAGLTLLTLLAGTATLGAPLRRALALGRRSSHANLSLMNSTAQFLAGLKLAVSQNLQSSFVAEFEATLGSLREHQIAYQRQQTRRTLALSMISACVGALAILIGFGVLQVPAALVITLLLIVARMNGPAAQIQQGAQLLLQALPSYQKVKELEEELGAAVPVKPDSSAVSARALAGDIVFRGVGFSYHGAGAEGAGAESATLRDLDLTIAPGSFIGITGESGAGKTTFADLLVGLLTPQSGQIFLGGTALAGATVDIWRNQVSYVAQDPFLLHDTVRRNLLWGGAQSSDEQLWSALAVTGADAFVRKLPRGLETMMGERGTLVSGGERQRLALARAILRRPQLLVLDEATNAIDIKGERAIIERLIASTPRPALVMIAHRSESLRLCQRIYVLERGRLVDV